jgi:hypothetical protein
MFVGYSTASGVRQVKIAFSIRVAARDSVSKYSTDETRRSTLTRWAFALMNIRAVCSVVVTALVARKLVDVLQVISAGLARLANYDLSIPIRESG